MGLRSLLGHLGPSRRRALLVAVPAGAVCGLLLLLTPQDALVGLRTSPLLFGAVCLAALANALVFVELLRYFVPQFSGWSESRHFRWVGVAFLLLCAVQYAGVRVALSVHAL